MKEKTMNTRLTHLGMAALVGAAVWAALAPAQEAAADQAAEQKAMLDRMAARVPGLFQTMLTDMVTSLREVHDKESADQAALLVMVNLHAIMGIAEYLGAMGVDTEGCVTPEVMKLLEETNQQESRFQREAYYGSALMACAWDHGRSEVLPEPTPAEKEAAGKLLDEMDARKVEDILASVKDVETADAAARAIIEKLAYAVLVVKAGFAPKERQYVQLSEKELELLDKLTAVHFYDSPLLVIAACEIIKSSELHRSQATPQAQGQQVNDIMRCRQRDLDEFLSCVQQAEKVRLYADHMNMANGEVREKEWELPAEEWQALKGILSRTKLIPVSKIEIPEHIQLVNGDFIEFRFLNAKGEQVKSHSVYAWESESRVKSRPADYVEKRDDNIWFLSDEDYATLHQIPTVRAAKEWQDS